MKDLNSLIESIIKNKTKCFFISPHLDDAVFSTGELMSYLSGKVEITVINVFTSAGDGKNTFSAKAYLKQCGTNNPHELYETRIAEDNKAISSIKAKVYNLGYSDALWRKKNNISKARSLIANYLPELDRLYPTYRFNISSGKIHKEDKRLIERLSKKIKSIIGKEKNFRIFCPVGFGNHVDHLLVRNACSKVFGIKVIYWSDVPYNLKLQEANDFIRMNNLKKIILQKPSGKKVRLCRLYSSQFNQVIKDKELLYKPEIFYLSIKPSGDLCKVSVGITAYNEAENIASLLGSILNQKQESYVFEKIIVISDGSTDATDRIVRSIAKRYKNVFLIADGHRKGKTERLNQLFQLNNSDILVILDADIVLGEPNALDKMIVNFEDKKVAMGSFHMKSVSSDKLIGKLINTWEMLWYEIVKNINSGDTAHNVRGGAFAIRKSLVKKISLPLNIHQVGRYLYHYSNSRNLKFVFARDAIIVYRMPDNFSDYVSILSRGDNTETRFLEKIFGSKIYEKYTIPKYKKLKVITKSVVKNPFLVVAAFGFVQFAKFCAVRKNSLVSPGIWETTISTKKAIKNVNF